MSARKPGTRRVTMTVGQAVRCGAMDCEASRPQSALMVWMDAEGRIHKRIYPDNQVIEDGLMTALENLPPGATLAAGLRRI